MPGTTVILYSRIRCELCDEARETILAVRDEAPFAFEERFIDGDVGLEAEYGERVPVVRIDGRDAFELHVDAEELRDLIQRGSGPETPNAPELENS